MTRVSGGATFPLVPAPLVNRNSSSESPPTFGTRSPRWRIEAARVTTPGKWWAVQDSNLRHPRCKRGALTAELTARTAAGVAWAVSRPGLNQNEVGAQAGT